MEPVRLTTERLVLDPPSSDDVDEIFRLCQDPLFERYLTVPCPYRREHAEHFVDAIVADGWRSGAECTWALRQSVGGPLLGVIAVRTANSDVGYWLGAEHRGARLMPEALGAVAGWAFDSGLVGLLRWECLVGNVASASVARSCGFTFEGVAAARIASRDGSHPASWHGLLRPGDDRTPKPGWPF